MDKAEFIKKYMPGNYTDEEFPELASTFENDLSEYARQERKKIWDKLAIGGLICGMEDMRKGCIQCQTLYRELVNQQEENK